MFVELGRFRFDTQPFTEMVIMAHATQDKRVLILFLMPKLVFPIFFNTWGIIFSIKM